MNSEGFFFRKWILGGFFFWKGFNSFSRDLEEILSNLERFLKDFFRKWILGGFFEESNSF